MTIDADGRLCGSCAGGDPFLATRIARDGQRTNCTSCGKPHVTFSVQQVGDVVHDVFKSHAARADDRYDYSGESPWAINGGRTPIETLQEEFNFPLDVAEALLAYLGRGHARDQHHDPGEDWYDPLSEAYDLQPRHSTSAADAWDIFVEQVRHHGRFFNDDARSYLDDLFGPLLRGELHDGTAPSSR